MKVLVKGREQKGYAVEVECSGYHNGGGGCGALLLVEQSDMYKTYTQSRGESMLCITFQCCECGVETDLDYRQRPPARITKDLPDKAEWVEG